MASSYDIDVLLAVNGDPVKFNQVYARLQRVANNLSVSLFSDPTIREDMVAEALNKASDWLGTDSPLHVDHPWSYVRRIVSNSLIDSYKTRKIEGLTLSSAKREMAWVDEDFVTLNLDDEDSSENEEVGSGWRVFQVIEYRLPPKETGRYHPHKWVEGLEKLAKFQWWWDNRRWAEFLRSKRLMKTGDEPNEHIGNNDLESYGKCKEMRWRKFNLIMALLDYIPSPREKQILQYYLWNYKAVEISRELNVSEAYISKTLGKWLRDWEWSKQEIYRARLLLLTHYVAKQYESTRKLVTNNQRLRELQGELAKAQEDESYWEKESDIIFRDWLAKVRKYGFQTVLKEFGRPEYPVTEEKDAFWNVSEIEERIREEENKEEADAKYKSKVISNNEFIAEIKSSPQSKIYFHDLNKDDENRFFEVCLCFYDLWFSRS
ncbi:MAG: hypothetical protein NTX46_03670 [Chloroflexi bacterium]|nr:hypothetical protein [Chloroflexota bacterium]